MSNPIDRIVGFFSPERALRRARARAALELAPRFFKRGYEAASHSYRTENWRAASTDVNSEVGPSLAQLRNRTRQLVRDTPWGSKAVRAYARYCVGAVGIKPRPKYPDAGTIKKVLDYWDEWAGTKACDIEGRHTFYGLQHLGIRTMAEGGEVLVRAHFDRNVKPIPLRLQLLEGDYLDETKCEERGATRILYGVEVDKFGARQRFWLYKNHPGDASPAARYSWQSKPIDAAEITHCFESLRAGQLRGVPHGAPCLIRHRDYDVTMDARMVREQVAAMFVGFLTDNNAEQIAAPTEGETENDRRTHRFTPGTWEYRGIGQEMQWSNPPQPEGFGEFATLNLREIAAGWNVSYEALTGDFSKVNMSSGRLGHIDFKVAMDELRLNTFIPQFCDPTWGWFLRALAMSGLMRNVPLTMRCAWTPPRWEMPNPEKEILADLRRVRGGITSLSEIQRSYGHDPEQLLDEIEASNKSLDERGIVLDSDPRHGSMPGSSSSSSKTSDADDLIVERLDLAGRNGTAK